MVGPASSSVRGRLITALVVSTMAIAACGGGDTTDTTPPTTDADLATSTTESASMTEGSETSGTTTSQPVTATTGASASAEIEVDNAALPADPTGFDTWSEDLCTLYTPEQLDAYFLGVGGLAVSEPLDRGCIWAVEGFPRDHYVDIVFVDDGTDAVYLVDGQIDAAGTQVDIAHGPEDIVAMIPTPDGTYLRVLIHGGFDAPPGPLGQYLDNAARGLAENLVSRF